MKKRTLAHPNIKKKGKIFSWKSTNVFYRARINDQEEEVDERSVFKGNQWIPYGQVSNLKLRQDKNES